MHPVLLIDDDAGATEALRLYLQLYDVASVAVETGLEALVLLRSGFHASVIVLDLMMPGLDGFGFRAEQLADDRLATIPVIVCSGGYDAASAAQRLGVAAFTAKPVRPAELLRLIRQVGGGATAGTS